MAAEVVFLFDVDNTLLDNDAFQRELEVHLHGSYGVQACQRYWAIFEKLRGKSGYADYLGALEQYRLEELHDSRLLRMANWLLDYPFADRLYPGAMETIDHVKKRGPAVILSDGDAVFQPRKIDRSGLWSAFGDNVLIYVHKQNELDAVERAYPAEHYVLVDDKLTILDAVKQVWGEKVTTVFHRQGHYAFDAATIAKLPPADITVDRIADLTKFDVWPPAPSPARGRGLG
jgi:FMN phosphatase YigB (HAD superfamily)